MGLSKIQNLKHKYRATKAQFLKKENGAHSFIERRPTPSNDVDS
jgi:hypothetical protein